MNRFSKTQIYLHWITLLFVAITYAAMELRGWFPKGSSTYLLMRETHYNAGIFVWVLMFSRLIIKHRYSDPSIVPPPPARQMKAASLMHIMLYITFLALPLLGIALMAYSGKSWSFLGFNVSPFVTPNSEIKALIKNIHETSGKYRLLFNRSSRWRSTLSSLHSER